MEEVKDIVQEQAKEAIQKMDVQSIVVAEHVADSVLCRTAYWEISTPNDDKLLFVRFFSPIVQREETYLGNILFNAFLGKTFVRAVTGNGLGTIELVSNDLENYYFLVRSKSDIDQMADAFRANVQQDLPDLFLGRQDEERGVYGDLSRMFTFVKSDFEPFPVYVVPQFLATDLEKAIREELRRLLAPDVFPDQFKTALATIAFFYGRTSGGAGDAQSFPTFVDHLVNDTDYDNLLKAADVEKAFNVVVVKKPAIKQSLDDKSFSVEGLRILLLGLTQSFWQSIDGGSTKWLMGFLHRNKKFMDLPPSEYISDLLAGIQIGYHLFPRPINRSSVPCRLCTSAPATIKDRYVTTGINSFRFDNQRVRGQAEKACTKCGLHFYLSQKLLGTEMVSVGGKLPQVPKTYNLIFHYGRHNSDEVKRLVSDVDLVWNLIQQHREAERVRKEVAEAAKVLRNKAESEQDTQKKEALSKERERKAAELEEAQTEISRVENDIFETCPWLRELNASPVPSENPSLDVLTNVFAKESKAEQHVLGLGMGGYRMILFILPQIRPPRDAKEHDFAQRRFSASRVTVSALLSFLRELCGCDGPFYYQSLPTLTPGGFQRDTFYIHNDAINVKSAQNEYEIITQLAWKLVWQSGSKGFVRKVILAEKLLADPTTTFASIMRDSPILGQKKGGYRPLGGKYRTDWGVHDLTEYGKFIQQLSKFQEVN